MINGISGSPYAYAPPHGERRSPPTGDPAPRPGAPQPGPEAASDGTAKKGSELSPEDKRKLDALKQRDQAVRRHEQAHMAAAGPLARGGPKLQYEVGPDGQRYAVSGEVDVDISPGRTPEETLAKTQRIRSAALAPADPSGADRAAAAMAAKMAADARRQLAESSAPEGSKPPGETASSAPVKAAVQALRSPAYTAYHGSMQCGCHRIEPGALTDLAI